jgi:site-specific DNA-methyltransferase (adenine-specific)
MNEIICGDCLSVMPTLPANSVDSIITDPPYGLDFMGKSWDHGVPAIEFWQAALRVAKPKKHKRGRKVKRD